MDLLSIRENCTDETWLEPMSDVDFAIMIAKAILLNNRVQQFSAADVVQVAALLLSRRDQEVERLA